MSHLCCEFDVVVVVVDLQCVKLEKKGCRK